MRRLAATPDDPPSVGDLYEIEGRRLWRAVFAWCQDRAVADDGQGVGERPSHRRNLLECSIVAK